MNLRTLRRLHARLAAKETIVAQRAILGDVTPEQNAALRLKKHELCGAYKRLTGGPRIRLQALGANGKLKKGPRRRVSTPFFRRRTKKNGRCVRDGGKR